MILTDLIKSIYKDVVKAQYDAYGYSLTLREQAPDSLFPIPTAKATDISLVINYAYGEEAIPTPKTVLNTPVFFSALKKTTQAIVQGGITKLIDYIAQNKDEQQGSWLLVRDALEKDALTTYVTQKIMKQLREEEKALIRESYTFNSDLYKQVIVTYFQNEVLAHRDMQTMTPGDQQWVLDKITPIIEMQLSDLQTLLSDNLRTNFKSDQQIIVDADQLKTLPKEAIQQMTIHLKVDELLEVIA